MGGQTTPTVGDHQVEDRPPTWSERRYSHRSRLLVVALAPATLASIYIEQLHQFRQEIIYVCGVDSGRHL
jgi:hypothetical protein